VIDSPPLFLPDASILLGKVDGVLLLLELGRTRKKNIKMAVEQINRSGAHIIGIVLNRTKQNRSYYSKYHYGTE
jgi:Mrp family chromosome partitioning ATPase